MKSRQECLKQLRAKYPNATQAELEKKADAIVGGKDDTAEYSNSIKGVEIFAAGTHNGDKYTEADLDKMVVAFGELDYRPAIKVGHTKDKPGAPAYGWVQNLRRAGTKLVADFTDMHDSVVDAVRKKLYDNVSAEIYFNLKRGGKTFDRALKAVALLGAEVPAVAGLTPLHKMEFAADGEYEKVFASEMPLDVSPVALFESLNERMASIIQSFNDEDSDMKTKAEQLKELNEKLGTVQAQLLALSSKTDKDKDAAVKELTAKVTEITEQIKVLSESTDDESARQREKDKAEKEALEKRLKESEAQIQELNADSRRRAVAEKVGKLRVPAFRPMAEALYSYGLLHAAEKVKVYSKGADGKDTSADKSLVEIADDVVAQINSQAEKLFRSLGQSGQVPREEGQDPGADQDAGVEFDKRVKAYMRDKNEASYSKASEAVQAADPELYRRYTEQTASRAQRHSH